MSEADVVIATTGVAGLIKPADVRRGQVIMALSNPVPEIKPESALAAGARFAADGAAVNNVLGFPALSTQRCTAPWLGPSSTWSTSKDKFPELLERSPRSMDVFSFAIFNLATSREGGFQLSRDASTAPNLLKIQRISRYNLCVLRGDS